MASYSVHLAGQQYFSPLHLSTTPRHATRRNNNSLGHRSTHHLRLNQTATDQTLESTSRASATEKKAKPEGATDELLTSYDDKAARRSRFASTPRRGPNSLGPASDSVIDCRASERGRRGPPTAPRSPLQRVPPPPPPPPPKTIAHRIANGSRRGGSGAAPAAAHQSRRPPRRGRARAPAQVPLVEEKVPQDAARLRPQDGRVRGAAPQGAAGAGAGQEAGD
jgi:hypothetical protein